MAFAGIVLLFLPFMMNSDHCVDSIMEAFFEMLTEEERWCLQNEIWSLIHNIAEC
jgi:hypothetical protein